MRLKSRTVYERHLRWGRSRPPRGHWFLPSSMSSWLLVGDGHQKVGRLHRFSGPIRLGRYQIQIQKNANTVIRYECRKIRTLILTRTKKFTLKLERFLNRYFEVLPSTGTTSSSSNFIILGGSVLNLSLNFWNSFILWFCRCWARVPKRMLVATNDANVIFCEWRNERLLIRRHPVGQGLSLASRGLSLVRAYLGCTWRLG